MKEDVLDYIRKHDQNPPVEEKKNTVNLDDDLLDEIHQKKQSTVLEKLERISILMSMLEMLQ